MAKPFPHPSLGSRILNFYIFEGGHVLIYFTFVMCYKLWIIFFVFKKGRKAYKEELKSKHMP